MQFPTVLAVPSEVVEIAARLEEAGHQSWCVGGALRDALLGLSQSDYDIATSATPEEVQALFRRTVPVGVKFGTVGVLDSRRRLHEVTTFRKDVSTDGRKAVVEYGVSLEEDLARPDRLVIDLDPLTDDPAQVRRFKAVVTIGLQRAFNKRPLAQFLPSACCGIDFRP